MVASVSGMVPQIVIVSLKSTQHFINIPKKLNLFNSTAYLEHQNISKQSPTLVSDAQEDESAAVALHTPRS